ncbi:hypothetical protein [Micromonospora sp. DT31]|uniref:hypothetical protein n=1 Tax=Micromonospora sp. DT31 TaxID=3393434 RepID=UPI003CE796F0
MASEERDGRVLLVGLTVLAVVGGAWWWRSAAPPPATAVPASGTAASVLALAPSGSTARTPGVWMVDPRTGEARQLSGTRRSMTLRPGAAPSAFPGRSTIVTAEDRAVLRESHVVWRETSRLAVGGRPVVRQVNPSSGDDYRLSVRCSGDGEVAVRVFGAARGARGVEPLLTCGGWLDMPVTGGTGEPVLVRFTAVRGVADLDARLVALY